MLILIGASASGKTEGAKTLAKKYNITKIVTYTTRTPRVNERNGVTGLCTDDFKFYLDTPK